MIKLSVSNGNAKLGNIPSVSLPSVITCHNCSCCAKNCYAARIERRRPSVRNAYANNLTLYRTDAQSYFAQVYTAACTHRFFRWHVSGDIPDAEYMQGMVQIAKALPHTEFLCFTKYENCINDYLAKNQLPQNLHIVLSAWGDAYQPNNPHNLPVADILFDETTPIDGAVCQGNCQACCISGKGCWALKKGDKIYFKRH